MEPAIKVLTEKKLIGMRMRMSISGDRTGDLWRNFMTRRREITNSIGTDLYSLQIYNDSYFTDFNPDTEFMKWAAAEVTGFDHVPDEMETFTLTGGLYAVFIHKGAGDTGAETFRHIFETWLPGSEYAADSRPHFEVLGNKYKNGCPDSEEEIWIPLKEIKP